jgi:hypothetical protein
MGGIGWIDVTLDRDKWRAVVKGVLNFRFHKMRGISSLTDDRLVSQEGLCFIE